MKILLIFLFILATYFGLNQEVSSATVPATLEFPSARYEGQNLLRADKAVAIASVVAMDHWDTATPGPPIICSDIFGKINYYLVPFRIDGQPFPSKDELFDMREQATVESIRLLENFSPDYDRNIDTSTKSDYMPENANQNPNFSFPTIRDISIRPDGAVSHRIRYQKERKAVFGHIEQLFEDNLYRTIIVSASRDQFPIAAVLEFLPPIYITGLEAKRLSIEKFRSNECWLSNIVFISPAEVYYKFDSPIGFSFVHWKTLRVMNNVEEFVEQLKLNSRIQNVESNRLAEYNNMVSQAWATLESRLQ